VNVGSPHHSFSMKVLADKRISEGAEMVMGKSAGHSTDEASNDRGGKGPRRNRPLRGNVDR
jgi:hypothetical protein